MSKIYNNDILIFGYSDLISMLDYFESYGYDKTIAPKDFVIELSSNGNKYEIIKSFKVNKRILDDFYDYIYENSNNVYEDYSFSNMKKFEFSVNNDFVLIGF